MAEWEDYYKVLGVSPGATSREIRAARNKLAMELHPDRMAKASQRERDVAEERLKRVMRNGSVCTLPPSRWLGQRS